MTVLPRRVGVQLTLLVEGFIGAGGKEMEVDIFVSLCE